MNKLLLVSSLAALLALLGCGGAGIDGRAPHTYASASAMVAEARMGVTAISVDELRAMIDAEESFFLIDVRELEEFDEGTIDGAFNVPRGKLEFAIASARFWDDEGMYVPEKEEKLILFSGKGKRGVLAAEALLKLGYQDVWNVTGGWAVWEFGPDALEEEEEAPVSEGCG
jgi:rhodanese-related sulfurtransferase